MLLVYKGLRAWIFPQHMIIMDSGLVTGKSIIVEEFNRAEEDGVFTEEDAKEIIDIILSEVY